MEEEERDGGVGIPCFTSFAFNCSNVGGYTFVVVLFMLSFLGVQMLFCRCGVFIAALLPVCWCCVMCACCASWNVLYTFFDNTHTHIHTLHGVRVCITIYSQNIHTYL